MPIFNTLEKHFKEKLCKTKKYLKFMCFTFFSYILKNRKYAHEKQFEIKLLGLGENNFSRLSMASCGTSKIIII